MSQDSVLSEIKKAVSARRTEQGERGAVQAILAKHGCSTLPDVRQARTPEGATVRVYLWEHSPAGDFALITGPSIEGEIKRLSEMQAAKAAPGAYVQAGEPPSKKVIREAEKQLTAVVDATPPAPQYLPEIARLRPSGLGGGGSRFGSIPESRPRVVLYGGTRGNPDEDWGEVVEEEGPYPGIPEGAFFEGGPEWKEEQEYNETKQLIEDARRIMGGNIQTAWKAADRALDTATLMHRRYLGTPGGERFSALRKEAADIMDEVWPRERRRREEEGRTAERTRHLAELVARIESKIAEADGHASAGNFDAAEDVLNRMGSDEMVLLYNNYGGSPERNRLDGKISNLRDWISRKRREAIQTRIRVLATEVDGEIASIGSALEEDDIAGARRHLSQARVKRGELASADPKHPDLVKFQSWITQKAREIDEAAAGAEIAAPFSPGDMVEHVNSYGDVALVNYRGPTGTGDGKAVVVMNGMQMAVPMSQLRRPVEGSTGARSYIDKGHAKAIFGGSTRSLPEKGETKPQPSDTSGRYFIGQTTDGRFFTEVREAPPSRPVPPPPAPAPAPAPAPTPAGKSMAEMMEVFKAAMIAGLQAKKAAGQ